MATCAVWKVNEVKVTWGEHEGATDLAAGTTVNDLIRKFSPWGVPTNVVAVVNGRDDSPMSGGEVIPMSANNVKLT